MLALLLSPAMAAADPLDDFGFGARAAGMAGSVVADSRGADAAHHNPAGVALGEHPAVLLGYGYGVMGLELSGRDAAVLDVRGATIGAALPFALSDSIRVGAGLALYLPDQFIARVQLVPPTEPRFLLLDNDPHRLVAEPVVAVQLGRWLAVGAGASLLANAQSDHITFDVGIVGGEKVGEANLDAGLPTRVAPLLGVMIAPHERVRGALVYRGELGLDLALDIVTNVDVAGVVTGDALVSLRASNYFTPRKLVAGVAADLTRDLTFTAEMTWSEWSAYAGGLGDLQVAVALDITPPLVQTRNPASAFENTLSGRTGIEARFGGPATRFALRAGYGYTPTPVPEQTGLTSFADNDRHLLATGLGITLADFAPLLTRPIDFDVALQWHHLRERITVKDAAQFPGAAFSSSGDIAFATGSMKVRF